MTILPRCMLFVLISALLWPQTAFAACATSQAPTPNGGSTYNVILGLSGVGPSDMWAVGYFDHPRRYHHHNLTEHWNGQMWALVPTPNVEVSIFQNELNSVAVMPASGTVWAVGSLTNYFNGGDSLLALRLTNRRWKVVPTPNVAGYFHAVSSMHVDDDAWAVGGYDAGQPLVAQWSGGVWSIVATPMLPSGGVLNAVSATSAASAWAVGSEGSLPLTEHWDGTSWAVAFAPNPGSYASLTGVVAIGDNDVWAVGYYYDGNFHTLTEHWNGSAWQVVPSPTPVANDAYLSSVSAVSTRNVWAAGWSNPANGAKSFLLHWVGRHWVRVPISNPPGFEALHAVSAFGSEVWSAGNSLAPGPSYWSTFAELTTCS